MDRLCVLQKTIHKLSQVYDKKEQAKPQTEKAILEQIDEPEKSREIRRTETGS